MIAFIWVTATLVAAIAILLCLTLIVIGIHRVDRAKTLTREPRDRIDIITRRILGVPTCSAHRAGRRS